MQWPRSEGIRGRVAGVGHDLHPYVRIGEQEYTASSALADLALRLHGQEVRAFVVRRSPTARSVLVSMRTADGWTPPSPEARTAMLLHEWSGTLTALARFEAEERASTDAITAGAPFPAPGNTGWTHPTIPPPAIDTLPDGRPIPTRPAPPVKPKPGDSWFEDDDAWTDKSKGDDEPHEEAP